MLLFASTWKLWTPQTEFPQIPFFEFLVDVPGWVDWVALTFVGVGLIACLIVKSPGRTQFALGTFVLASSVLIVLNQHRLQPWAYQFVIFAIIMATTSPKSAMKWMRWIAISIYIYSAISKFDYQFVHTVGDQMLATIFGIVGIDAEQMSDNLRNGIALSFPLTELAIGIALAFNRTRRIASYFGIAMHATLLVVLIVQVQLPGVLIWNLFFIATLLLLFNNSCDQEHSVDGLKENREPPLTFMATFAAAFVLIFPLTQPLGICDHWPAWQVYAPRTSRARIRQFSKVEPIWNDPSKWSQTELRAPVYPQARFQLAVAMATLEKQKNSNIHHIDVASASNWLTGSRMTESLSGDQIEMQAERYRLNVKPRSFWFEENIEDH